MRRSSTTMLMLTGKQITESIKDSIGLERWQKLSQKMMFPRLKICGLTLFAKQEI